jgi:hypothetical protein
LSTTIEGAKEIVGTAIQDKKDKKSWVVARSYQAMMLTPVLIRSGGS